jgi:hypothetical protein
MSALEVPDLLFLAFAWGLVFSDMFDAVFGDV